MIKTVKYKNIYIKTYRQNYPYGERLNAFSLGSKTREVCPCFPLLFNIGLEVLASAKKQGKNQRGN